MLSKSILVDYSQTHTLEKHEAIREVRDKKPKKKRLNNTRYSTSEEGDWSPDEDKCHNHHKKHHPKELHRIARPLDANKNEKKKKKKRRNKKFRGPRERGPDGENAPEDCAFLIQL